MAGENRETTTSLIAYYRETGWELTRNLSHSLEFKTLRNSNGKPYETLVFNDVELWINTSHMTASERRLLQDLIITAILHTETQWKLGKLRDKIQNAIVPAFELKAWNAVAIADGLLTNTTLISEKMYWKLFPNPGLSAELTYEEWTRNMQASLKTFLTNILTQRNMKSDPTMVASKR